MGRAAWALLALVGCGARTGLATGTIVTDAAAPDAADGGETPLTRRTLAMSWNHACAITSDGGVACWGDGFPPTAVAGITGAREIATIAGLTCALTEDGTTSCWGDRIGTPTPTAIAALPRATRLFAGGQTVCVTTAEGTLVCGGHPIGGQCAPTPGSITLSNAAAVPLPSAAAEVAIGGCYACARLVSGEVSCWGSSGYGALGSVGAPPVTSPTRVPGIDAVRVATESDGVCAMSATGQVTCWGDGSHFGTSLTVAPTNPISVDFGGPVSDLDVAFNYTCAVRPGSVVCKGALPTPNCSDLTVRTEAVSIPNVREVAIGLRDRCARDTTGAVWCWGCNEYGESGDTPGVRRPAPFRVPL